ncbi:MAG: carboxypeptidase-like regulatory domain-containing protein [Flavobacteriaceae bacterium]|nr:carboxypeptidase-like regulatory domain-containing protein [Flavobacteriaceae bacterium]
MNLKNSFFFQKILISIFLIGFFSSNAQTIKIKGKVTDSISNPLKYANVFAVPKEKEVNITYAITNEKGNYILNLKKGKTYQVTTRDAQDMPKSSLLVKTLNRLKKEHQYLY